MFVFEYLTGGGAVASAEERAALMPAGRLMRDALVADLLALPGVCVSAAVCADAAVLPAGAVAVTARPGEATEAFVARVAARHDLAWVIAPETDGLLARYSRVVGPRRWIGCSTEAIELLSSKSATLRCLHAAGIATPLAFGDARRWVVKPDDGAGALDTWLHDDAAAAAADLAARHAAGRPATMEPWVEGEALSASLLCRAGEAEQLSVNCQDVRIGPDGAVQFCGVAVNALPVAEAIGRIADAVLRAVPGLRGFVGIDLVWHAQRGPVVIEVNPRVTCAYEGVSAALERNLAAEVLAAHALETADA